WSRCTKAAVHGVQAEGAPVPRNPMVGSLAACCARAANGHAAAAPPTSLTNSRRFMFPRRLRRFHRKDSTLRYARRPLRAAAEGPRRFVSSGLTEWQDPRVRDHWSEDPMEGGCTCRQIRYRLTGTPLIVHACHCRWCQRETGTAHALNALYE